MGKKVYAKSCRSLTPLPLPPPSPIPSPNSPTSTKNLTFIGIQSYLDNILHSLNSGDSLIGIYGPGGAGKTTLLKSIFTTLHAEARTSSSSFDFIIFAEASLTCNPAAVQRHIASHLGLKFPPLASSKTITQSIFNCLKNRSFLLLLDDLSVAVDLTLLGIPESLQRAVVITTRHKEVCNAMGRNCRLVRMDCLASNDAFALFSEKVGVETLNSDHRIRKIAEEIINDYCQRLPLALTATAIALSSKKTYEDWVVANRNLKKSSANFPGMGKSFFPLLKLSYDNLDEGAKRCFLSCALWPENYSICTDELIECWMGLGFIDQIDVSVGYSHGCCVIEMLKGASLLTPGDVEKEVKMHQTIRGLAIWIASDYGDNREKWILTPDSSPKNVTHHFNWSNSERVSFMYNDIESVPLQTKCDGLTTLILKGNMSLTNIPQGFFARMPGLTYLDLSNTGIEMLPADIRRLTKLKYLNLSHTRLNSLPMDVEHLKELEYLLLFRTLNLKPIPRKVLQGLSKLRVLDLLTSGNGYDLDIRNGGAGGSQGGRAGADIVDLECFGRDMNRKSALALGIMVVSVKAVCRLSKLSGVCTRRLCMNNLEGFRGTLDVLSQNMLGSTNGRIGKSLRELIIMNCDRLVELTMVGAAQELPEKKTAAAHGPRLLGLEILQLLELRRMKEISWKGVTSGDLLPSLKEVTIYKCDELKNVSWVLELPSLEYLQLQECAEMEQVIEDEANLIRTPEQAFPKLKGMILDELPRLSKICNQALGFPALESLQVSGCPKLARLPFGPEIRSSKLKKIQVEKKWWECLQWEDKSIKRELLDCCFFIPPRTPLTTLPSRRRHETDEKRRSLSSFYRAVLLPISLPFMLLSLSTVLPPSVLLICVFLLFMARWGLLQR